MIYLVFYTFAVAVAVGAGILAGWSDFRDMKIPNILPLIIGAAFFIAYAADYFTGAGVFLSLKNHLAAAALLLFLTFVLYVSRMFGGGDSKLMTAYGLWTGFSSLVDYIFFTALLGALLGGVALALKRGQYVKEPAQGSWVARVQAGENTVPYGIPIALGAFIALYNGDYVSFETLSYFLMSGGG